MVSRIQLYENVFLTHIQSEKFKTGCFSVNFLRPLRREEATANALIPSVLLGGCKSAPDIRSISIRLDSLYGATVGTLVRKKGAVQAVGFYADHLEDALADEPIFRPLTEFVSELLLAPLTEGESFAKRIFENERDNLRNDIRAEFNQKQAYANRKLLETMYAGHPYALAAHGSEDALELLDPKRLYAQYRCMLANSQTEIFYLGRANRDEAVEAFTKMLALLPRETAEPFHVDDPVTEQPPAYAEQSLPLAQSKLSMGFFAPRAHTTREQATMLTYAVLLGGGSGSKLFRNVREAKSLCYYANALYDKYVGFLRINSGIAQEQLEAAISEIRRQLEDCAAGRFTDRELEDAKLLLLSQLRADLDIPARLDEFYLGQTLLGQTDSVEALMEALGRVDRDAVQAAAAAVREGTTFFLKGVGECE